MLKLYTALISIDNWKEDITQFIVEKISEYLCEEESKEFIPEKSNKDIYESYLDYLLDNVQEYTPDMSKRCEYILNNLICFEIIPGYKVKYIVEEIGLDTIHISLAWYTE